jgi:hypothetical protein
VGDLAFQRKCFDRMEDLIKRDGKTVLLVSHNVRQVERICSRVVLLSRGTVALDGSPNAACRMYFEDTNAHIAQYHGDPVLDANNNEYATGAIQLRVLEVRDAQGDRANVVRQHGDVLIRAVFEVRSTLSVPRFGFGFHTSDFLYLATHHSHLSVPVQQIDPGEHLIECVVRNLPFAPGTYGIRVGVAVGEAARTVFYAENLAHLRVEDADAYIRTWQEGIVTLDTAWSMTSRPGFPGKSNMLH